jgi:peptidoglycan/xylan/chitin deacetylase (PgdA/CDA1 family)
MTAILYRQVKIFIELAIGLNYFKIKMLLAAIQLLISGDNRMIMKQIAPLASLLLALTSPAGFAAEKPFTWPNGVKAAISLAYDDAVNSQLDNAIPALDKYNLKGTFYITLASDTVSKRMAEWRKAAVTGHELANHTLFHQCSRNGPDRSWVNADNDLDKVSVNQLVAQIRVGNTMLHAIDGKTERTYTTPCGDLKAGGENYLPAIKSEFVAIKAVPGGVIPDMNKLDIHAVGVDVPVDVTGKQLISLVKRAAKQGTMANLTFHGIGGDHLSVSKEAHEELLKYLADNKDIYWTDTFINIMKYVKENQQK